MDDAIPADFVQRQAWQRPLLRMVTPGMAYRLAGWERSRSSGAGRLVVLERGPGRARLRYSTSREDDRARCLRRQAWALDVVEHCGGKRKTLQEHACLAWGDPACEYTVSWTEPTRATPAVLAGLLAAVGVAAAWGEAGMPASRWLLVPIAAAAAHALERWRAGRGDHAAASTSDVAFRWLLARALAARPAAPDAAAVRDAAPLDARTPPAEAGVLTPVLEQEGDFWRIGYEGTTVLLRHSRGLALLAQLVRCPGRDVHVCELDSITPSGGSAVAAEAPAPEGGRIPVPGDAGEVLDARALAEYRGRVAELRKEVEDAEERHDLGQAEAARAELDVLLDELRGAVGVGGRARRMSADVERLRVAITRRIRAAIAQIAKHHPALGAHLAASVTTGYHCSYNPGTASG
jgi:hypothetical protein